MLRFWVYRGDDEGSTYYRHVLPVRHLAGEMAKNGVTFDLRNHLRSDRRYSACFFQRWVNPSSLPAIGRMKKDGVKIIWDLDDDVLDIGKYKPENRSAGFEHISTIQWCLDLADLITVSVPELIRVVNRPDKTIVVPNLIDLNDEPFSGENKDSRVILYAASRSHDRDVDLLRTMYDQTKRDYDWVFFGIEPTWLDRHGVHIPWVNRRDAGRVARMLKPIVCLGPLEPTRFNLSKSPIKAWESARYGARFMATDFGPYFCFPGAAVYPGDEFNVWNLEHVIKNEELPSAQMAIADDNSWQHGKGVREWREMFLRVKEM
jgi:hypothetical protein